MNLQPNNCFPGISHFSNGLWSLVFGLWSLVFGLRSLVFGLLLSAFCFLYCLLLLLTAYCSLLTAYCSLLTAHCPLLHGLSHPGATSARRASSSNALHLALSPARAAASSLNRVI